MVLVLVVDVLHYQFRFYCVDKKKVGSVTLDKKYWFVCIMIVVPEMFIVNSIAMLQTILEMQQGYKAKKSKCQQRLE